MDKTNSEQIQKDRARIQSLRLIDDDFMTICFDNNIEGVQLLLRIILGRNDLVVTEARTQKVLKNLYGRDIWLDIYAEDSNGIKFDIEIQRSNAGAHQKRARYHSSMVDSDMLDSGCEFTDLRENYVIFITENDVLKGNRQIYHIDRFVVETGKSFDDGEHIVYVNGSMKGQDTELGRLMHDFYCTEAKDFIHKELADRVKYYKENEEGIRDMCQVFDEVRNEGIEQGIEQSRIENALEMIGDGLPLDKVAKYSQLSIEKVRELAGTKTA